MGFTNSMALAGSFMMSGYFSIEGAPHTEKPPEANLVAASAGYFHAMGMPLLAGRYFTEGEALKGDAAVINEAAARKFFGNPQQAVGRRIIGGVCKSCEIAGVARNLKNFGLTKESVPELYGSLMNMPCPALDIVVPTYSDRRTLALGAQRDFECGAWTWRWNGSARWKTCLAFSTWQNLASMRRLWLGCLRCWRWFSLAAIGVFGVTAYWAHAADPGNRAADGVGCGEWTGTANGAAASAAGRRGRCDGGSGTARWLATRLLRSLLFVCWRTIRRRFWRQARLCWRWLG